MKGGSNDPDNLVAACVRCNLGKGVQPSTVSPPPSQRESELEVELEVRAERELARDERLLWAERVNASNSTDVRLVLLAMAIEACRYDGNSFVLFPEVRDRLELSQDRLLEVVFGLVSVGYLSPILNELTGGPVFELAEIRHKDGHFRQKPLPASPEWIAPLELIYG